MTFVRKLYYDAGDGLVIASSVKRGNVRITGKDEDMESIASLAPYKENPDGLGLFQWTEPDPEVEENMAKATGISVDVSQTPHVIVYDFTPIESATLTSNEVVGILTGEVE